MLHRENCSSTCINQIWGLAAQKGGNCIATVATLVGGPSVDILVTLYFVCRTENLIDGENLVRVTNCSFWYIKIY